MKLEFQVAGPPVPQGSMRAFIPKGWTRAIITSDNPKLKQWRADVNIAAQSAMEGEKAAKGEPVQINVWFYFKRPKEYGHPDYKTQKPDVDKLARAIMDSLKGVAYDDDSQVVKLVAWKLFGIPERAEILAQTMPLTA